MLTHHLKCQASNQPSYIKSPNTLETSWDMICQNLKEHPGFQYYYIQKKRRHKNYIAPKTNQNRWDFNQSSFNDTLNTLQDIIRLDMPKFQRAFRHSKLPYPKLQFLFVFQKTGTTGYVTHKLNQTKMKSPINHPLLKHFHNLQPSSGFTCQTFK